MNPGLDSPPKAYPFVGLVGRSKGNFSPASCIFGMSPPRRQVIFQMQNVPWKGTLHIQDLTFLGHVRSRQRWRGKSFGHPHSPRFLAYRLICHSQYLRLTLTTPSWNVREIRSPISLINLITLCFPCHALPLLFEFVFDSHGHYNPFNWPVSCTLKFNRFKILCFFFMAKT